MKMEIKIFQNEKQVNEITSTNATDIYKKISQILHAKLTKRATKTQITYSSTEILKAVEFYDTSKTQLKDTYTYIYTFKNVSL